MAQNRYYIAGVVSRPDVSRSGGVLLYFLVLLKLLVMIDLDQIAVFSSHRVFR